MTQLLFNATVKFQLRYSVTILTILIGPQIGQKLRALLNVCTLITH